MSGPPDTQPATAARQAREHLEADLASLPSSQLAAMKLIVNQAYENMGLGSTQLLGPVLDGLMRNTPDARSFIARAASEGVPAAVRDRDAPFGDYSAAEPARKPAPDHVIAPPT